jgi:SOS-response transcriptional repressor LexA
MNQKMYEVLTAIVNYRKSRKVSPTVTEINWMVSIQSKSAVGVALDQLVEAGYISREKRQPRNIEVLRPLPSTFEAAKAADGRKGKTISDKKALEAERMQLRREVKRKHKLSEAERMQAAIELGKKNDGMDAFLIRGAFFKNRRVTGCKVG